MMYNIEVCVWETFIYVPLEDRLHSVLYKRSCGGQSVELGTNETFCGNCGRPIQCVHGERDE